MPRSNYGGRHELGQNFLTHKPTIARITSLVEESVGPILEIGAGDGALTRSLASLGRPVTAIDIDEHRARRLRRALPRVCVEQADALRYPLRKSVIVGNVPFHLTTPILRRLLASTGWREAVLLTQWEVARKRAGVGGSTMMTAQAAPWFTFDLHNRVPSWAFAPRPSVDGGIIRIRRRPQCLIPTSDRARYSQFVKAVFAGRGGSLDRIIQNAAAVSRARARRALAESGVAPRALPRDVTPEQWAALWRALPERMTFRRAEDRDRR